VKQCSLIHTSILKEPAGCNGVALMEATRFSETMLLIYPTTQQHIPEHCVTAIKSESRVTFFVVIFTKSWRVTINLVMSVRTEQLGSKWTDFMKFDTRVFFDNLWAN